MTDAAYARAELMLMNMWNDVFGSVGKRTMGTSSGNFLKSIASGSRFPRRACSRAEVWDVLRKFGNARYPGNVGQVSARRGTLFEGILGGIDAGLGAGVSS